MACRSVGRPPGPLSSAPEHPARRPVRPATQSAGDSHCRVAARATPESVSRYVSSKARRDPATRISPLGSELASIPVPLRDSGRLLQRRRQRLAMQSGSGHRPKRPMPRTVPGAGGDDATPSVPTFRAEQSASTFSTPPAHRAQSQHPEHPARSSMHRLPHSSSTRRDKHKQADQTGFATTPVPPGNRWPAHLRPGGPDAATLLSRERRRRHRRRNTIHNGAPPYPGLPGGARPAASTRALHDLHQRTTTLRRPAASAGSSGAPAPARRAQDHRTETRRPGSRHARPPRPPFRHRSGASGG